MTNGSTDLKRNSSGTAPSALETLNSKFEIRCHCLECGWSDAMNPELTQNQTLDEFKQNTRCPSCLGQNISISIHPR